MNTPARGRLYTRLDHQSGCRHLIVCFNGYGAPADGVRTHLQNFGWLSGFNQSSLWCAEAGPRTWYTGFDFEVQQWLRHCIRVQGIEHVTLLGSSAGGYASIRHALLIGDEPGLASACAFAINPQTGFGAPLLQSIRATLQAAQWRSADFGENPVLPRPQDLCSAPDSVPEADLCALEEATRAARAKVRCELWFDAANPIDAGFAMRFAGRPGFVLRDFALKLPHAEGAKWLWQCEPLRAGVQARLTPGAGTGP